jgi:hypothetical protein
MKKQNITLAYLENLVKLSEKKDELMKTKKMVYINKSDDVNDILI